MLLAARPRRPPGKWKLPRIWLIPVFAVLGAPLLVGVGFVFGTVLAKRSAQGSSVTTVPTAPSENSRVVVPPHEYFPSRASTGSAGQNGSEWNRTSPAGTAPSSIVAGRSTPSAPTPVPLSKLAAGSGVTPTASATGALSRSQGASPAVSQQPPGAKSSSVARSRSGPSSRESPDADSGASNASASARLASEMPTGANAPRLRLTPVSEPATQPAGSAAKGRLVLRAESAFPDQADSALPAPSVSPGRRPGL
jgi:hypothetical protein